MVKMERFHKTAGSKGHSHEKQQIEVGLKRWGRNAYLCTLSDVGSVGVLRGNNICQIQKGNVDVLAKIPQTRYKVTQRSFKLKK